MKITLNLSPFEFGQLYGALSKNGSLEKLTERLKLKLDKQFTMAYLNHPTLGKQAKKDIKKYDSQLRGKKW